MKVVGRDPNKLGLNHQVVAYGYDLDGSGPAVALADHRNHIHAGFGPA